MKTKFILFVSTLIVLASIYLLDGYTLNQSPQSKHGSGQALPQNPMSGRIVFEQKGCIDCHSINGSGGKTAPDFSTNNFFGNGYDLISAMWNHSPEMLKQMDVKNINRQNIDEKDFRSLRYFLNFLRYLDVNGNVKNGQLLFSKMKCNDCHSIEKSNTKKISLSKMGVYASPLYLAQVMWNHAAKMQKLQMKSGIKVPVFKKNEFADLSSYIELVSANGKKEKIFMLPGNPLKGKVLFKSKKCFYCHEEKHIGPDLTKFNFNKSVTEIAGMMWDHASSMETAMTKYKISYPEFKNREMANLISYLYFKNQSQIKGSAVEGNKLISEKGCIGCHSIGNSFNAPAIDEIGPFYGEDSFFSALWNHLPMMERTSYAKGKSLPKLLPSDVKSLYLYFNRKVR